MKRLIKSEGKEKSWVKYIKGRISKNKNFICFVSGATGGGKSWSSLGIAQQLDQDFNIDQVVFSARKLMDLINSSRLKKGSVIVFEEVGIELDSHQWHSVVNRMIKYLFETFRHRNFILILNSPFADYLDSSIRKLLHAEFICKEIDYETKQNIIKPQIVQYNGRYSKFYYKYLRVRTAKGKVPIVKWRIGKADDNLIEEYEKKKKEFTDSLNKRIYDELDALESKQKPKELTQKQQEIVDLLIDKKTIHEIASIKSVNESLIRTQIRLIKKKGFKIEPKKDGSVIKHYNITPP